MSETSNERFERLAEVFYDATGKMAPGKDVPIGLAQDDEAERIALWRAFNAGYRAATPPTPDLAAVVARQRLDRIYEATAEGEYNVSAYCEARDALLAAVSRPAEARGEPVAWGVVDSKGTMCWAEAEKTRKLMAHLAWCDEKFPEDAPHTLVPLYAAPRPEPGEMTEAMVETIESLPTCEIRSEADEYHGRDGSLYVSLEDVLAVIRAAQREPTP